MKQGEEWIGNMIKAVIFDLDNTLVKTDQASGRAYSEACKLAGFNIKPEMFEKRIQAGERWDKFLPELTKSNDAKALRKIRDAKAELYPQYFKNAPVNPKMLKQMDTAVASKRKVAVATTASRVNAEALLKHIGVLGKLDLLLTGEDVKKAKPDPEIYLKAAEKLGVKPEECLAYEDSDNGFKAAKAAGMQCSKIDASDFE